MGRTHGGWKKVQVPGEGCPQGQRNGATVEKPELATLL